MGLPEDVWGLAPPEEVVGLVMTVACKAGGGGGGGGGVGVEEESGGGERRSCGWVWCGGMEGRDG